MGPLGTFVAEPVWDKEEIVYATLDLKDLTEARVSVLFSLPSILRNLQNHAMQCNLGSG